MYFNRILFCIVFYVSSGIIMVGFIFGSKRFGFNPDNIATPMAASFGDLLSLALLAGCSQFSFSIIGKNDKDNASSPPKNTLKKINKL